MAFVSCGMESRITMYNSEPVTKPNACKRVYKYNSAGELVYTYERISDAVREEHVAYTKLKDYINSRHLLNGHHFSMLPVNTLPLKKHLRNRKVITEQIKSHKQPWESDDGMFDIRGWAKVCL